MRAGGWQGSSPGRGKKGPIPLSLAAWEPLGAQPQPSQASSGCELPATTSYHPAASTCMRQAGDEGQSGMKKTKEKPRTQKCFIETNSVTQRDRT